MKKRLSVWQKAGFVFTALAGVVFHFLFDWTGGNFFAALFSAVNESVFEHMKLLFFPMFFFALLESRYIGREYKNFWCVKLLGIMTGVFLIPTVYYTIRGAFGDVADWVNIALFFITAAISFWLEERLLNQNLIKCKSKRGAIIILCIVAALMMLLTFVPPHIPLFEDAVTKTYGFFKTL